VPVLGITGGVATGKTFFTGCLARRFQDLGPALEVFDSDACARELTTSDREILAAIRTTFGGAVFDESGVLQRPALRAIVFADPQKRKALEAILHPTIRRTWLARVSAIRQQASGAPGSWLAIDIPLLFETSAESYFDRIIAVACSAETQMRRLMENRRLSASLAEGVIASQLPMAEKVQRAHFAIWNDGAPDAVEFQAGLLARHLLS
jgi:dephospho-CoA kinase